MKTTLVPLVLAAVAGISLRAGYAPIASLPAAFLGLAIAYYLARHCRNPILVSLTFGFAFIGTLCLFVFDALTEYELGLVTKFLFYIFCVTFLPSLFVAFSHYAASGFLRRSSLAAAFPITKASVFAAAITTGEWLRTEISPEHGWAHMASVVSGYPNLLGLARYTGSSGITFLLASMAALSVEAFQSRKKKPDLLQAIIGIAACIALLYIPSLTRARRLESKSVSVAVITPQISQKSRWQSEFFSTDLALFKDLSLGAELDSAEYRLVVWPETAVMYGLENPATSATLATITSAKNGEMIVGLQHKRDNRTYNSAFVLGRSGNAVDRYDKIRLLPFAETGNSPFSLAAEHDGGMYRPGNGANVVRTESGLKIGLSICFESAMEDLFRRAARDDAALLVNLSNDSWFGSSSESEQQLAFLVLRAVETGLPLVRATGYGTSAIIDASGRILTANTRPNARVINGKIAVSERPPLTPFVRYGHWFIYCCLLFLGVVGARIFLAEFKRPA